MTINQDLLSGLRLAQVSTASLCLCPVRNILFFSIAFTLKNGDSLGDFEGCINDAYTMICMAAIMDVLDVKNFKELEGVECFISVHPNRDRVIKNLSIKNLSESKSLNFRELFDLDNDSVRKKYNITL